MPTNRPSDALSVFDPTPIKIFDGQALSLWMEAWRYSPTDIARKLGVTTQTISNWRHSKSELRPWVKLALTAIEADEQRKRANGGS